MICLPPRDARQRDNAQKLSVVREHSRPKPRLVSHAWEHHEQAPIEKTLSGGALLAAHASKRKDGLTSVSELETSVVVEPDLTSSSTGYFGNCMVVETEHCSAKSSPQLCDLIRALPQDSVSACYSKSSDSSLYSRHAAHSSQTCPVPNGQRQRKGSSSSKQCSRDRPRSAHVHNAGTTARCLNRADSGSDCNSARTRHRSLGGEKMQNSPTQEVDDSQAVVLSRITPQSQLEAGELRSDASTSPKSRKIGGPSDGLVASAANGTTRGPTGLGSGGAANREKVKNMELALRSKTLGKKSTMAQFLQKNHLDAEHTVFVLSGPDDHIRKALLRRELKCIENCVPGSELWNLKWCVSDCDNDYKNLQEGDLYNHFQNNRELTTKAGLVQNLQRLAVSDLLDVGRFFPRSYDMSLPSEREDFILDFRRCAALNVALQHRRLCAKRERLFGANAYLCNTNVLATVAKALQRWVDDLNGSHLDEADECSLTPIDDESWDALVLYSEVSDAQLCQLEAGAKRRERNRGFSVSGGILLSDYDASSGNVRQTTQQPTTGFQFPDWPEFSDHQWKSSPPEAVQARLDVCVNILETEWPQIDTHGPMNVWIVKPGTNSKASGVMCMSALPEVLHHCKSCGNRIVQKYIERPLLLFGGRKFDIRQWVLVRSFVPLEAYMFSECYLRLCNDAFDLGDLANRQRHISNWSVNKHGKHIQEGAVASLSEFCAALKDITGDTDHWAAVLQPKLKEIILHSLKSVQGCVTQRPECFELYGFDFMIGENLQPWLLEVNLSPACEARTAWISELLERMSVRLLELVLDGRTDPDGIEPDWICISEKFPAVIESGVSAIGDITLGVAGPSVVDAACAREDFTVVGHGMKLRNFKRADDGLQKYFAGKLIQRVARGFLVRHRIRQKHRNLAAAAIQRAASRYRFRRILRRRSLNRSSLLVQAMSRRFFAVASFIDIVRNNQARCIQCRWRGNVGRRVAWHLRRKRGAELIQYHLRRWRQRDSVSKLVHWWRRKYCEMQARRGSAARTLQSFWRGKAARRFVKSLRVHIEYPARRLCLIYALARWRRQNLAYSANVSVRRLQNLWRSFSLRRVVRTRILQRRVLRCWQRQSIETLAAVNLIQRRWLRTRSRLYLDRVRSGCKLLQRAWRAHKARRYRWMRTVAVVRLQAATRGWFAYRGMQRARKRLILVQAAWRRQSARREVRQRRLLLWSSKIIQCAWRRVLAHREAHRRKMFLERSRQWVTSIERTYAEDSSDTVDNVACTDIEGCGTDSCVEKFAASQSISDVQESLQRVDSNSVLIVESTVKPVSELDEIRCMTEDLGSSPILDLLSEEMTKEDAVSTTLSPRSEPVLDDGSTIIEDTCNSKILLQDDQWDCMMPVTAARPSLKPMVTQCSTSSLISSQASVMNQSTTSANDRDSVEEDEEESREDLDAEVEPFLMRVAAEDAPPAVAVRSESGTDLHVKPSLACASYPPMQLLSAPRHGWMASPRDTACRSGQENDVARRASKASPPASVGETERKFEAKILGFVSQAERKYEDGASGEHSSHCRHGCVPRLRYTEDTVGRGSGGSALHAARGLRDASSGSSRARSASARRSKCQQETAKLLSRYGEVASLSGGLTSRSKRRSRSRSNHPPKPEDVYVQSPDDAANHSSFAEKKFHQRRLTIEEILEIATSTITVRSDKHLAPRAKLDAAIAASAGFDVQMKPSATRMRPSSAKR